MHWRTLEEYLEGCLDLYNQVCWDDEMLKHLFLSGMNDVLGQMLLLGEDHRPFTKYVDYTLWVCGFLPHHESL